MHNDIKNLTLPLTYEVDPSFDSDRFIKLRLRFIHDGLNPNQSFFSTEVMEGAKPSLANIPILAHVVVDSDGNIDHGSHDMHIEQDLIDDKKYRVIYDEQPIGVVPETNNYEVSDYNGRKYAYTDAYLWVGYCGYSEDIVKRDTEVKLSIEIDVLSYVYDSKADIYNITDFVYKGITLLGQSVGTGMVDARATTETFADTSKEKLFALMTELKQELKKHQSSPEVNINGKSFTKETEGEILNEKVELVSKYSLKVEDLGFDINDLSLDDLETKLKNMSALLKMSTTYNQKREALRNCVNSLDSSNTYTYHWLMDFDESFLYIEKTQFNDTGYVDTHGRMAYSFDDAAMTATITGEWEDIYFVYLTAAEKAAVDAARAESEQVKADFESYKADHATPNTEVEELRTFKITKLADERKVAETALFTKFEKLNGNEEFENLKVKSSEYEISALEEKCFALLGKMSANFAANTPKKKEPVKVPVDYSHNEFKDGLYERFFEEYKK